MKVIECNALEKKYGDKKAIDGLNLSLEEEKIIGLVGRNGAGKTTFLKICAGLLCPTGGELKIWGKESFNQLDILSKIVFSGEDIVFSDLYRIKDILNIAAIYYEQWQPELAKEIIKIFNLDANMKIKKLSKGMKSMVNITIALCSRQPLTLFDEPTSGLDAAHRKDFYNLIIKEFSECPRTIIISSHLLSEVEPLLEEVVLIDNGKVILHEPVDEIRNYLVQLEGTTDIIKQLGNGKTVWNYYKTLGKARICIKRNDLSEEDLNLIRTNNLQMTTVSSQDTCIYLTEKGGMTSEE